jgi:hypothetical protein
VNSIFDRVRGDWSSRKSHTIDHGHGLHIPKGSRWKRSSLTMRSQGDTEARSILQIKNPKKMMWSFGGRTKGHDRLTVLMKRR